MNIKKYMIVVGALVALMIPSAALAAPPSGQFAPNPHALSASDPASFNGSLVGFYSSRITQNGEFIGGTAAGQAGLGYDNTTAPGSRAAIVQALLGH